MAKQRIVLLLVVCLSVMLLAAQPPSYTPPRLPPHKPGVSQEEYKQEVEKAIKQQRQEHLKQADEYISLAATEAWTHLLRTCK